MEKCKTANLIVVSLVSGALASYRRLQNSAPVENNPPFSGPYSLFLTVDTKKAINGTVFCFF